MEEGHFESRMIGLSKLFIIALTIKFKMGFEQTVIALYYS
jgi:hypothetical protein